MGRPQAVRMGSTTSSTLTLNTGAPQGCVLSPLLYSLFTHDCVATHSSNTIIKFADDTTVIGLITGDMTMRRPTERRRRQREEHAPLSINGTTVERVNSFRFLGVHISEDLTWTHHTDFITKSARQRLFFLLRRLQRLNRLNMDSRILCSFYRCTIERILTGCITAWYSSCTALNRKALQREVKAAAQHITRTELPSMEDLYTQRCRRKKATKIIKDPSHPATNCSACCLPAAMSQTTQESKLEALQCHFTWDLDSNRSKLLRVRDKLEDIGTQEGNCCWLGHIYNLRGFVQYKLGFTEDAQSLFNTAAEAFSHMRKADEGPWLVVNYGNLAWLHDHLKNQEESQAYLSKVDALMKKYPSPSEDELHPEIYAEKAWTLMKFSREKQQLAADYFQRAIRMQPDMVEWKTSHVLLLISPFKNNNIVMEDDLLKKMRVTKEQDPEDLYLAVHYLDQRAKKGERIEDEAHELAREILRNPVSSYSEFILKHSASEISFRFIMNISGWTCLTASHDLSAAQSQTTLESQLEALQCHFTWDLDPGRSKLLRVRDKLEDIGTQEGNCWLGHIYNLRGFIQYKLGFTEDALSLFNKAAEAFSQMRKADEGPWLVVNYGNLAWLHHHLKNQEESQAYLSKVDTLMKKYPSPSEDEPHPEIYAEKAWTLMKFSREKQQLAADYFQRAIRMQPDMVEWHSSHVLVLISPFKNYKTGLEADLFEKMRIAKEQDPEDLYLAVHYLEQRAKKGERIEDEARELAREILRNPVSSYSGMSALLWIYIYYISVDKAIDLAEEALKNHPDVRYLKRCAALCYKWIILSRGNYPEQHTIDRAISLHKEVISLYPHSSLMKKIDLAKIYTKSYHNWAKAEQMYQELLESDLEPADKQMLYHNYANYLRFNRKDSYGSIKYHMEAAAIPHQSFFRENSIRILKEIEERNRKLCTEIEEFFRNLQP
ncbi:hypothetical protein L3Q82_008082 [Scortum barcoo]|uniref:Uncharacterized protein n=1 Tax=Scortum barcoo TaxID=214431 RepID=A0ACB8WKN0_9TELE|nr:hypothetical protein L3Q82_008082 [Scortum barcoo]